jgi:methionine synthase II (cobalamin-independent)
MFNAPITTGIGSLPHLDKVKACKIVFDSFDIPFWPQLPNVSFLESMIPQYSESMPFIKYEHKKQRAYIERDDSSALDVFYNNCGMDGISPITSQYSSGISEFIKQLDEKKRFDCLKGHITGPITFTLGLKDSFDRYIFYDEELREIALMLLKAKARWQVRELSKFTDKVIIFIDEPILSATGGSAYLGVSTEEMSRLLSEVISAIKEAGAISAIHCCGKADWDMVIGTQPDILNFDAFSYFDTFCMYHPRISQFIERGGYLAWGIVPTTNEIQNEDINSIYKRMTQGLNQLSLYINKERLLERLILTPSCGAGSLNEAEAEKVFSILKGIKGLLQRQFYQGNNSVHII